MRLRVNITANFIGQMITTGIGFIFIPIYVHYLGAESFGLIGIFSMITAWFGLLDAGLTPAICKEMALYSAGKHSPYAIRKLLKSIEFFFILVFIILLFFLNFSVTWISVYWIKSVSIPLDTVKKSIWLMGILLAVKFFESIYKNSLIGLQLQVKMNIYESIVALLRACGALLIFKFYSTNIIYFFGWQLMLTCIYTLFLKIKIGNSIAVSEQPISMSFSGLKTVSSFATGMTIMSLLSLFHSQIDKILLSKILPLESFGYYTIATTAAGALMIFTTPISQAIFPRLNQLHQLRETKEFVFLYHIGNQLILILLGSTFMIIFFYPRLFLTFWTNNPLVTQNVYQILAISAIGFFFSGINTMSAMVFLTFSWIKKANIIKFLSLLITVPLVIIFVPKYGSVSAAYIWAVLSSLITVVTVWITFRSLKIDSFLFWISRDFILPLLPTLILLLTCKELLSEPSDRFTAGIMLFFLLLISMFLSTLFSNLIRIRSWGYLKSLLSN
jgi:O-antigen/teichoic acid export membrane protein